MDTVVAPLIGIVIGLTIGFVCAAVITKRRSARAGDARGSSTELAVLEARHAVTLAELKAGEAATQADLQSKLSAAEATITALGDQIVRVDGQYREQIGTQEARLAEFQQRLRDLHTAEAERVKEDGKVLVALSPVKESLEAVQRKVVELEEQRRHQYGELSQQLKSATESEERLRSTAESLASALKSNSTRGVWGETQLRSVVESAGLLERVNFDVQSSVETEAGVGRPDMIVRLPGGKSIAVDAKVPFNSYLEAVQIPATATDAERARRERLMKQHVKAVRDHIVTLGSKAYWEGLDSSPEMVIAFIPSESLVSSALEADPSIMEFAFAKRVALSSPVTLWSVLKTVAFSWQQNVLTEDAKVLFDVSRELFTRLSTMASHVDKLGRSITSTVNDYNRFIGSLERTVLPSARKLNSLDESKVIGTLDAINENPRELAAIELVAELEREGSPPIAQ